MFSCRFVNSCGEEQRSISIYLYVRCDTCVFGACKLSEITAFQRFNDKIYVVKAYAVPHCTEWASHFTYSLTGWFAIAIATSRHRLLYKNRNFHSIHSFICDHHESSFGRRETWVLYSIFQHFSLLDFFKRAKFMYSRSEARTHFSFRRNPHTPTFDRKNSLVGQGSRINRHHAEAPEKKIYMVE